MKRKTTIAIAQAGIAAAALIPGWTTPAAAQSVDARFSAMMSSSFREQGIAKLDRIKQDAGQAACSTGKAPDAKTAARIVKAAMASIAQPSDGRYLGDWKKGEALAQSGRGMTWTDASAEPQANGANCYNCHQITKAEIAYGTIGPSLYNYGKIRGVTNPDDPASAAMIKYTWGKMYNAWAYNACSNMPRFGYRHLLDESQMKDVMALLLDPASPVNAE